MLNSLKKVLGSSQDKSNHDLIQVINAHTAGQEPPKNIDILQAYLKSMIILPILTGSQDFDQDKNGKITFHPDANVSSVSTTIDDWQVFIGFLEPEAVKKVPLPSLTRLITIPFTQLLPLLENSNTDGTAIFFHTKKGDVGLAYEQTKRMIENPKIKSFEPEGLIKARENYRDLRIAHDLSLRLREQLYRKFETMPDIESVWVGHLIDQNVPKYFIHIDTLVSSKRIYEEINPLLMPELNREELIHFRVFDGFTPWIKGSFPPFYSNKKKQLSGWGLDKFEEESQHSKKQRPTFKQKR